MTSDLLSRQPPKSVALFGIRRIGRFFRTHAAIVFPALLFFALTVALNWHLFVTPMVPWGDVAVNALQVENAKHFHAILGNYSRWHIHHPGPFLFYVFAAGEAVFYDWLHVVPAPLNGECLAEIAFSTACLFLAIHVFYANVKKSPFPPLAILVSILFLYAVDSAIPGSAMASLWPPYAPIFCFLLLVSSCASVAAGNWRHTPLLALSGMIMIHAHAAQLLFAPTLAAAALAIVACRELRLRRLGSVVRTNRYYLMAAIGIVLLFILPIAIDWAIDHPNNIHQIRLYLREHHGKHNSIAVSALYALSFLTYDVHPEVALAKPVVSLAELLNPAPFVKTYWVLFLFIAIFALVVHLGRRRKTPEFVKFVLGEIVLVSLLFLYWAWRITGGMYNFNGYFFFSIQLFALLGFCALLASALEFTLSRRNGTALACAFTTPLLLVTGIKSSYFADPAVARVVSFLRATHLTHFSFVVNTWPVAAGVGTSLERSGINFCVEPGWKFMFGPTYTCGISDQGYRVSFSTRSFPCRTPCSVILNRPGLYVTGAPNPTFLSIPAHVIAYDSTHEFSGFNILEDTGTWSKKQGILKFYLGPLPKGYGHYTMSITGIALAGRPVQVKLNGAILGTIGATGQTTQKFEVDSRFITWNGSNVVALKVPHAAPMGTDPDQLGYFFEQLTLRGGPR